MKRLGVAALCIAVMSTGAQAHFDGLQYQPCDNKPPPAAQRPIDVFVDIQAVPGGDMFAACRKAHSDLVIYGCTYLPSSTRRAVILLNGDQDPVERTCTLVYEEAHLPPNNWLDAGMEAATPDAPR